MEHARLDRVARTLAVPGETRRAVLRLLAGGALGAVAARLGRAVDAEAGFKSKRKDKRRKERQQHESARTEGKRRKKKKKSGKKKRQPQSPPGLCPHDCADDGGKCCPDGSCVSQAFCCPGERMCADGQCQPQQNCCPDEYQCPDGTCIAPLDECCPGQRFCGKDGCIPENQCCPDALAPLCTECQEEVCDNGSLICRSTLECPPEWRAIPEECRCEQCEEICDPALGGSMCEFPGCGSGQQCINGLCNSICTDPAQPQLCCTLHPSFGVHCYCTSADTICYNCGGDVCGCVPGSGPCCQPGNNSACPPECACQ